MLDTLLLHETQIVGGIVGNAIQDGTNAIIEGITYGFQYVIIASAKIIGTLSGIAMMGEEMIFCASKDDRDKGKIVKYFLIYVGTQLVVMMVRAISRG